MTSETVPTSAVTSGDELELKLTPMIVFEVAASSGSVVLEISDADIVVSGVFSNIVSPLVH